MSRTTLSGAARLTAVASTLALLAGCMDGGGGGGGTASPGVGTAAGAAAGVGASRLLFGNSTSAMLLGGAAGGLAGNMTLDRQAEQRRQQDAVQQRAQMNQLQLDFQRQQALQAEQTRIEIEEQRLFQQWKREQAAKGA
jgi:Na+/glutamate symporter